MFAIELLEPVPPIGRGRITVGDFAEEFETDLRFWAADDYREHWRRALDQLAEHDGTVSCLVTSMADPARFAARPPYRASIMRWVVPDDPIRMRAR